MFFLFYLILFLLSNRTNAINKSLERIPKIEEMYPLPMNNQLKTIAAQFYQSLNWEDGNMPMSLPEAEETTPIEPSSYEMLHGPGVLKHGHLFQTEDRHPYLIDRKGVHRYSEHHIFLIRHGLYFYTEDEPSSHLLRYGKYQARMAGHAINRRIHEILAESGPLTRPIKLVSSTQTRALETLYNIRLQLSNHLEFEPEIIRDSGLTECVKSEKQRMRWLYFVREYLQPIKSNRREHSITIIASHGNLLTTFDYIIRNFISRNERPETFAAFPLPVGVGLSHAETLLYRTIGAEPVHLREMFTMDGIPMTINHAQLRKDFYYEWAAMHQCRSEHGREDMSNYIKSAILDNVFSTGPFDNSRIRNYHSIVYTEMEQEFDTHLLPMMVHTCRSYLYRLPFIQANTNFESFNRLMSPIPIPESEEEQSSILDFPLYEFNAYGMSFPVNSRIQKFRKDPIMAREPIPHGAVHPESRDDRTSYLTRLGINQIRGIVSNIHHIIYRYIHRLPGETRLFPINVVAEPTIQSAESCFHVKSLLDGVNYTVSEQFTDLGLQFNYYQKKNPAEFLGFQRVQILYMLQQYLKLDQDDSTRPSLQIHILCGDGRLFTAFRQELALNNILTQPYSRFSAQTDPGYNALKHGNAFFFEAAGDDTIKSYDVLTLAGSRDIRDDQKVSTDLPLQMPMDEYKHWLRRRTGACSLAYFLDNKDRLSTSVVNSASFYRQHIARLLKQEWHPYLAGLFIYACRLQLTMSGASQPCLKKAAPTAIGSEAVSGCYKQVAGPGGDCA